MVPNWETSRSRLYVVILLLSQRRFNFYAEYIMQNARMDEAQARIKIAGRNISNLRYADDTTLNGRKLKGTKESFYEGERRE